MKAGRVLVAALLLVILISQASIVSGMGEYDGTIIVHKFHDRNGNGVQDANEEDIEGWLIRIYKASSLELKDWGTTGPDGTVTFTILNGAYKVWEEMRDCWEPTTAVKNGADYGVPGGYFVAVELSVGETETVEFGNVDICEGFRGCTPGFWKQEQHFGWWPISTDAIWDEVFGTPGQHPGLTLLEALSAQKKQFDDHELLRHATAAYLNCEVLEYPYCGDDILNTPVEDLVFANEHFICPLDRLDG